MNKNNLKSISNKYLNTYKVVVYWNCWCCYAENIVCIKCMMKIVHKERMFKKDHKYNE